jgi:hypothetical protein
MLGYEQSTNEQPLEVGYIIAYEDGRLDRFGRFPLPDQQLEPEPEPEELSILKKIVELEPSTREASYIFGSIRLQKEYDLNPRTIEYKKDEIKTLLRRLARPGIVRGN